MTRHAAPLDVPTVVLDETGRPLSRGEAYTAAEAAAVAAGAPDPRACADRYLQGLDLDALRARDVPPVVGASEVARKHPAHRVH